MADKILFKTTSFLIQAAVLAGTKNSPTIAKTCAVTAKRIAEKSVTRISQKAKKFYCRKCGSVVIPGSSKCGNPSQPSATMRVRKGNAVLHCSSCGFIRRFPKPKKQTKSNATETSKQTTDALPPQPPSQSDFQKK